MRLLGGLLGELVGELVGELRGELLGLLRLAARVLCVVLRVVLRHWDRVVARRILSGRRWERMAVVIVRRHFCGLVGGKRAAFCLRSAHPWKRAQFVLVRVNQSKVA